MAPPSASSGYHGKPVAPRPQCRKHCKESTKPSKWWPQGQSGRNHPLTQSDGALQTQRSQATTAGPTPRPAGFRLETGRSTKEVKQREPHHLSSSQVPMGENLPRSAISTPRKSGGTFDQSAGKGTFEAVSPERRHGYAWGIKEKAAEGVQKSFEGAAGSSTAQLNMKVTGESSKKKVTGVHAAAKMNNFHRGLTNDGDKASIYDFHPTSQGRKARSAPRRKSQAGGLIHGAVTTGGVSGADAFNGNSAEVFKGAAGVSCGHWADARYLSTSHGTWG